MLREVAVVPGALTGPVLPGDTEATLSARVLAREHAIYPKAVRWVVEGVLREEAGVVTHTGGESQLLM